VFRIKICGVTRVADACDCVAAGADALGLNFYPASPRSLSLPQARAICETLPGSVARVGVFVNASLQTMRQTVEHLSLDWIQLHGDEAPDTAVQLAPLPVVQAFRVRQEGFEPLLEHLSRCREAGQLPAAVLVDAYQTGAFGGTGQVVDWTSVAELVQRLAPLPVVLAGGLCPENIAEAIRVARPHAVDTASGVEFEPGRKDPQRVRWFVERAREGFNK
jgi:phosphoribosylanthranilate isomerase